MTGDRDWHALAVALRQRRKALRLRQADLEARGGPSQGTVRNIEQAARTSYARRTFQQLEHALDWPDGLVERILDGTADPDELNKRVVRGTGTAHLGLAATASGERDEPADRAPRRDSTAAVAAELLSRLVAEHPDVPSLDAAVDVLTRLVRELAAHERG